MTALEVRGAGAGLRLPLEALVFAVGMSTLGAEIAAARLMAPFFGSSTVIWANTIAVVLLALSAGYRLGGRAGRPAPATRGAVHALVLLGSALLAVVPFIAHPFLSLSVSAFDELSVGAFTASLFGTLVLVAVPLLLLGAVSPWATRLRARDGRGGGRGRRAAVRDLDHRLAGRRVLRLAVGDRGDRDAAHVPRAGRGARALVAAAAAAARAAARARARWSRRSRSRPGTTKPADERARALRDRDAVPVRAGGRAGRTARGGSSSTRARRSTRCGGPDTVLTGGYWDGFLVLPFATGSGRRRRGSPRSARPAGRSRAPTRTTSRTRAIDAVDIDPELFKIGHRYFGLQPRPQLREYRAGRAAVPAPDEASATTRSSSTPTASPTSPST